MRTCLAATLGALIATGCGTSLEDYSSSVLQLSQKQVECPDRPGEVRCWQFSASLWNGGRLCEDLPADTRASYAGHPLTVTPAYAGENKLWGLACSPPRVMGIVPMLDEEASTRMGKLLIDDGNARWSVEVGAPLMRRGLRDVPEALNPGGTLSLRWPSTADTFERDSWRASEGVYGLAISLMGPTSGTWEAGSVHTGDSPMTFELPAWLRPGDATLSASAYVRPAIVSCEGPARCEFEPFLHREEHPVRVE